MTHLPLTPNPSPLECGKIRTTWRSVAMTHLPLTPNPCYVTTLLGMFGNLETKLERATGRRPGLIDSVERPQIGTCAFLDRVARHNDPWNCDSPLSPRCDLCELCALMLTTNLKLEGHSDGAFRA